ncbi:uncharacterized protein LOC131856355 [Cryptomeria japonica]|uniref:uncharacterized protein LOC131856355 n=1 Tax=Cryptomeria japonica TaxID=3369 RepID=UPI0027DA0A80|nr:uncharacterized protein LOC131856355 [Cryptomeria japonica]
MVKPKKTKSVTPPKPRQTRSTPSSGSQKHVPPSKPQSKSSSGEDKRKKGKPERVYVAATTEEEIKSNEAMREVKKSVIFARVVKKKSSSEIQPSKKQKVENEQSRRHTTNLEDERLREYELVQLCLVVDFDEANQTPPMINIESEKNDEEVGDEKGEDEKKGEKEKDGEKVEHVPMTRDTVESDKGKKIISDIDLTQGPMNLNSLSYPDTQACNTCIGQS